MKHTLLVVDIIMLAANVIAFGINIYVRIRGISGSLIYAVIAMTSAALLCAIIYGLTHHA